MIKNPLHPGELVREVCIVGAGLTVTEAAHQVSIAPHFHV